MAKLTKKQKAAAAIVDSHTLISSSAALPYFLQAPANPRKFSYLLKTTRKTKQKQQALTT